MMFWVWVIWVMAVASPTLIWEVNSAEPAAWKTNKTKGYIVLPLVNEYCEQGPTQLYWEVSSVDGKEHSMQIECFSVGSRIYQNNFTVAKGATVTQSAVLPLQGLEDYNSVSCVVLNEKMTQLQSTQIMYQEQNLSSVSKVVFLGTERTQQTHPEWMISTIQHRRENMVTDVNETKWLPQKFTGYFGIKTVVWFESERSLSEVQEQAVLEWVKQGGHLVVVNSPAFHNKTIWSPWLEQRFSFQELNEELVNPPVSDLLWSDISVEWSRSTREQYESVAMINRSRSEASTLKAYRVGRGRISIVDQRISAEMAFRILEDPFANQTGFYATFTSYEDSNQSFDKVSEHTQHPFFHSYKLSTWIEEVQLFNLVPAWVLRLVLWGFVILIGPVNMFWKGSRLNWVWRTPLIALFCTIVVLGLNRYLNSEGRGLSNEFVMLDLRSDDLFLRKERLYFVGKSALESEEVHAHSQHLPMNPGSGSGYATLINEDGVQDWINFSKLRDVQALLSWHQVTQRRGLRIENGVAYNDLDQSVFDVLYRDKEGAYWQADTIAKGESISLVKDLEFTRLNLDKWNFRDHSYQNVNNETVRTLSWNHLPKHTALFLLKEPATWDAMDVSDGHFDKVDGIISNAHTLVYEVLP